MIKKKRIWNKRSNHTPNSNAVTHSYTAVTAMATIHIGMIIE